MHSEQKAREGGAEDTKTAPAHHSTARAAGFLGADRMSNKRQVCGRCGSRRRLRECVELARAWRWAREAAGGAAQRAKTTHVFTSSHICARCIAFVQDGRLPRPQERPWLHRRRRRQRRVPEGLPEPAHRRRQGSSLCFCGKTRAAVRSPGHGYTHALLHRPDASPRFPHLLYCSTPSSSSTPRTSPSVRRIRVRNLAPHLLATRHVAPPRVIQRDRGCARQDAPRPRLLASSTCHNQVPRHLAVRACTRCADAEDTRADHADVFDRPVWPCGLVAHCPPCLPISYSLTRAQSAPRRSRPSATTLPSSRSSTPTSWPSPRTPSTA